MGDLFEQFQRAGWTITALAKWLGVTRVAIYGWKRRLGERAHERMVLEYVLHTPVSAYEEITLSHVRERMRRERITINAAAACLGVGRQSVSAWLALPDDDVKRVYVVALLAALDALSQEQPLAA